MRRGMLVCPSLAVTFAVVSMFSGTGCRSRDPEPATAVVQGPSNGPVAAAEVTSLYTLINQERARRGYASLTRDTTMEFLAAQYSNELQVANVSSYNFVINDLDATTRLRNAGIGFSIIGHQGAINYTTASSLVTALLQTNSFVISDSQYGRIGIGVANNGSRNYWTIFVVN